MCKQVNRVPYLQGIQIEFNNITFSSDSRTLASASEDGSIRVWDVTTGEHKQTFISDIFGVDNVSFSADGKTLIGVGLSEINLWDVTTSMHKKTFQGYYTGRDGSVFSSDGKTLVSPRGNETIILWDVTTDEKKQTLTGHESAVSCIAFSADGKTLASGGLGNTIYLWDINSGKQEQTLIGHKKNISTLAFSPDGKTLASGSRDKTIYLWDTEDRQTQKKHSKDISCIYQEWRSARMGKRSQVPGWNDSIGGNVIILRDAITGKQKTIIRHTVNQVSVSFSPDGTTLASGGDNGTVLMWDPVTGKHKKTFKGHKGYVSQYCIQCGWQNTCK